MISHTKPEYNRKYYLENRDKVLSSNKEYRQKNWTSILNKNKSYKLKWRYGISLENFQSMVKDQDNLCKICSLEKPLVVDHCHSTNKVRGLICQDCNKGLGFFKDSLENLKAAQEYLE